MTYSQLLLNLAHPGSFELFILISVSVSLALQPILFSAMPVRASPHPGI